jgi:hypothetical protein
MGCDATERENLLAKADRDLEFLHAMHEESETTETFRAYMKMEELRIAYLRGQSGDIGTNFDLLAKFFNRAGEFEAAERAENFASACRNYCNGEVPFQSSQIEQAATAYESLTAASSDPLVMIGKQFLRQLSGRYEEIRYDHEVLRRENCRLLDRLRQENLRFQDRLAQLKNAFGKMMEAVFGRSAARSGRGAARVGHNPNRLGVNTGRLELNSARLEVSTLRSLFELEWGEFFRDACDRFAMVDDSHRTKYADDSAIKGITGRDYFVEALDDFIASMEASRSNQPSDILLGGPPDRAESELLAEELITPARSLFAEENEKVWAVADCAASF